MRFARGFTLVELITVIVILAIVAVLGSGFVVTAVESYKTTQERAKLVQKGRLAIEQMTRQLRIALPNSIRTSSTGSCVEFLPIVGGASYLEPVPDIANNAPAISSINTSPVNLGGLGTPAYVAIGALSPTEVYTTAATSPLAGFGSIAVGPPPSVNLTASHRFIRNSTNKRLFITGDPTRFCISGTDLVSYSGYGLIATLSDTSPGVTPVLIAADVAAPAGLDAFILSGGSEDRNTAVLINLLLQQGDVSVELNHQVLVRNVP